MATMAYKIVFWYQLYFVFRIVRECYNFATRKTFLSLRIAKNGEYFKNPFTSVIDRDRISPYNINTISSRQVMRIKTILTKGN